MKSWSIVFTNSARTELKQLAKSLRKQANGLIRDLAEDPVPADAVKLRGLEDYYRIRLGRGYRIV